MSEPASELAAPAGSVIGPINILDRHDVVPCPYCGEDVVNDWKPNSEYVLRCPMPCSMLFAVRTHGSSVRTARIDWYGGVIYWLPTTRLSEVPPNAISSATDAPHE